MTSCNFHVTSNSDKGYDLLNLIIFPNITAEPNPLHGSTVSLILHYSVLWSLVIAAKLSICKMKHLMTKDNKLCVTFYDYPNMNWPKQAIKGEHVIAQSCVFIWCMKLRWLREQLHPKNENDRILYSPLCGFKLLWVSFFY